MKNNTSIIIGFSKPNKFKIGAWLIEKTEKTEFDHVYIKLYSKSTDRYLYYQASGLEVNFMGDKVFTQLNTVVKEFRFPITDAQQSAILVQAIDLAGTPYGIKELFGMAIVRFMSIFNVKMINPFSDGSKTYICSELVGTIMNSHLGYNFKDLDSLSPKDIYDTLNKAE